MFSFPFVFIAGKKEDREGRQDWDEESRQNVLQNYQQGLLNQPNLNLQAQQALLNGQQGQFNNQLNPNFQGQQVLLGNHMNLQGQQGFHGDLSANKEQVDGRI